MLSNRALSEAAISSLPDRLRLVFATTGTITGNLLAAARLRLVSDLGDRPVFAVEVGLAQTIPTITTAAIGAYLAGAGNMSARVNQVHRVRATFTGSGAFVIGSEALEDTLLFSGDESGNLLLSGDESGSLLLSGSF